MKKIAIVMLVGLSWITAVSPVEAKGKPGTKPRKPSKPVVRPLPAGLNTSGGSTVRNLNLRQN